MSKICDLCGKSALRGNLVPRGIGNRATRRTIRHQEPNLRIFRSALEVGGNRVMLKLCSSCLKRLKKDKRDTAEAAEVASKVAAATA